MNPRPPEIIEEELDPDSGYYGERPTMHDVRRLIAALRTSREEVERLTLELSLRDEDQFDLE